MSQASIDFRTIGYASDVHAPGLSFGSRAAEALGVDASLVCKTLLVQAADGELVVAVIPVGHKLDLRALAQAAGVKKVAMADSSLAERRSGYVVGGISPFGQRNPHRTFVDASVSEEPEVFVSGGRRGFEVVVPASAFVRLLDASFHNLVV